MLFLVSLLLDCVAIALLCLSGIYIGVAVSEDENKWVFLAIFPFILGIALFAGLQIVFYYSLR